LVVVVMSSRRGEVSITGKRIAIPVFFKVPSSGLHENVKDTIRHLREQGASVSVFSPPGPFCRQVVDLGAAWFELNERGWTPKEIVSLLSQFDLVHAHPGPARKLGLRIAKLSRCPFLITFHGAWLNHVHTYSADCTYIIAVSDAIAEAIEAAAPEATNRIIVVRNGSNFERQIELPRDVAAKDKATLDVCVASRFDQDKILLVEFLKRAWRLQGEVGDAVIRWHVAGAGSELNALIAAAEYLNSKVGRPSVTFYGWLGRTDLDAVYANCDIAVCPGRSAIDAMALGLPVIAVGSKGCAGLVTSQNFALLSRSNFGGFGLADPWSAEEVIECLRDLAVHRAELSTNAQQVYSLARAQFAAGRQNRILQRLYERALQDHY
jgi:glycosyltransferase involved in cell wall biosynthesis